MTDDHWFDSFVRSQPGPMARRSLLGTISALAVFVISGSDPADAGKGSRKKGKGKGARKGKKKNKNKNSGKKDPKPPEPPQEDDVPGICFQHWYLKHQEAERQLCKLTWEQCPPGGDEKFCIIQPDAGSKTAACCELGQDCCSGACRDIWSDPLNCNGCDRRCGRNETCIAGECVCDIDLYDECPGIGCVNTLRDPENCGQCGKRCPSWLACINGECKCAPGRVPCDNIPNSQYPNCIRPTDTCCRPFTCSGSVCCYHPSNPGNGVCLTECPSGWIEGLPPR